MQHERVEQFLETAVNISRLSYYSN